MRIAASALTLLMTLAAATGTAADTRDGQRVYAQRCAVCHAIVREDGTTVVRGGGSGPNLFGVVGRQAASAPGFDRYGEGLTAVGAAGFVWTEAAIAAYLEDPRGWLTETLGDRGARSRMAYRLRNEAERAAVAAYLATQR